VLTDLAACDLDDGESALGGLALAFWSQLKPVTPDRQKRWSESDFDSGVGS
jgi:hypothetical protein